MSYKIECKKTPERYLTKLPEKKYLFLTAAIEELAENPLPPGCVKLRPYENIYRIRKNDFRIIYEVRGSILRILILDTGSRGQIHDNDEQVTLNIFNF